MLHAVLVVGPSWVGDMVMAQSMMKCLKSQYPNIDIDVLAPDWSREILGRIPEVRESLRMPLQHGQLNLTMRYQLGKSLRSKQYQQAFVLTNSWKSALVPFWAKIPKRTGWLGEARWGLLNDVRYLDKNKYTKMVERYVALAYPKGEAIPKQYPAPQLTSYQEHVPEIFAKLHLQVDLSRPILALCPGAAYGSAKRWPEQYFVQLAQEKIKQGWQVWVFGSGQDKPVIDAIVNQLGQKQSINLAGKLNLLETVDVMSVVHSVVCNDSGLMHTAAALGKPLVAVYGSTSSAFTPPLGKRALVLQKPIACRPCFKRECPLGHHKCMKSILPEEVNAALESL